MKRYLFSSILLIFFHSFSTKAQLCNGTLGDPIFMETFGSGTGPGPALPSGTTTYNYTTGWPTDGQYTIANTSNPLPGNPHWYTGSDHTGNKDGYMFIVNASYAPGEFFRYTVSGLCSNTTYVFSAWLANVNNFKTIAFCKENDPPYVYANVLFKVQNSITLKIDSISTGNIAPDSTKMVWHQYGFTFSTGANQSTVTLTMVNNSKGGCGNDLVIDDISFRPCGPSTAIAAIPSKKIYCTGDSIVLDATIGGGYNNPVYQWQFSSDGGIIWQDIPGANQQDLILNPIALNHAGKYRLILAEKGNLSLTKCRIITESITIKTATSPVVDASSMPTSICKGFTSTLSATGANTYVWSNGTNGVTTQVSPSTTTTYTVIGMDTATGCTDLATAVVDVRPVPASVVAAGPDSICAGNTATLTATAPGGTYKWYETATGGTPLYTGNPFQTPALTDTKTYYVEVESAAKCTSVSRTEITVVVNKIPSVPVVTGADTVICSGNSVELAATAPGGTYKWYDAATGGTPIYVGNPFKTPILNATQMYYVEVESGSKCTSTSRTVIKVTVNTVPIAPVVTGPDSICSGHAATLTATAPGGTYDWYDVATGGTPLYTGNPFQIPSLTSTKTYYVEVSSAQACTSTSRTAVTVVVNAIPTEPVVVAPDTICSHDVAVLKATAPGGTYKWYDVATGGTPVFSGDTYLPVLASTKTFYVEVVSGSQCVSLSRTPVMVTVLQVHAAFTADPYNGIAPLKVNFTNQSTGADFFKWDVAKQFSTTTYNTSYTFSKNGEGGAYQVTLIATNNFGCWDTTSITIHVNAFSELIIPNVFTPNGDGVNDLFNVKSIGLGFVKAELFDRWGLKLYEWSTPEGGWDGTAGGIAVPDGIYYYIIIAKGADNKEYKLNCHFTLLR
jgi:gliding motility-associated-like protein